MVPRINDFENVVKNLDNRGFVRKGGDVQVLEFGCQCAVGVQDSPCDAANFASLFKMFPHVGDLCRFASNQFQDFQFSSACLTSAMNWSATTPSMIRWSNDSAR